jgi:NNP family nitrate/nitrite transporter-like MFS transporter
VSPGTSLTFDVSFMAWTMLGAMGSLIAPDLGLTAQQKFLMASTPILAGAFLRIGLSLLVDRIGAKRTGLLAQVLVMAAMAFAWQVGVASLGQALLLGIVLGIAGGSFAVAPPQAGRWYPPQMQGVVLRLAGAGHVTVAINHLLAPHIAARWGWQTVFGFCLIPLALAFVLYAFFYTTSFDGFVGLATAFAIYFRDQFQLSIVEAGELAALCTLVGGFGRPAGGAFADRMGGIRALSTFYSVACVALVIAAVSKNLWICGGAFFIASGAFGMCNGSVFQLLPQRFARDISMMTGLVGCGGCVGGFVLGMLFGMSKEQTGDYLTGILAFAGLCVVALIGLKLVKIRWRTTWGANALARI